MNPNALASIEASLDGRALVFLCVLARISGLLVIAPGPWSVAPVRVRGALAVLLAFVATASPLGHGVELSERPLMVAFAIAGDFGIGACMGMAVRLVIAAAEVGAEFIAPQLGIGVAQLFDPHLHTSETPVGAVLRNFALLLAVLVGLHRQVLGALLGSFHVIPPGELVDPGRAAGAILTLTAQSVDAGVRIALPTVAVLFMVQVALAFIARAAPQLQIFSVGFAVTLGVGMLVLVVSLPDSTRLLMSEMSHLDERLQTIVLTLAEPSP